MERPLQSRKYVVGGIFLVIGIVFIVRLFYLQVINQKFVFMARQNVLRYITQYPARGLIYDRNGELLVYNEAIYDLMVTPKQVGEMDTTLFCNLLEITKEEFEQKLRKARTYSPYAPSVFEKQISSERFCTRWRSLHSACCADTSPRQWIAYRS